MMGAGRIGSFQLESPVSIEFWLSLPRAAAQCAQRAGGFGPVVSTGRHSHRRSACGARHVLLGAAMLISLVRELLYFGRDNSFEFDEVSTF